MLCLQKSAKIAIKHFKNTMTSWNHYKVCELFKIAVSLAPNIPSLAAHKIALAEEQAKKEDAIKEHEQQVKALEGRPCYDDISLTDTYTPFSQIRTAA